MMGVALVGALGVWLLIGKRFSLMYGIPAIPLMWGRILLNTTPEERRTRPVFKALGIILIVLFIGVTIIGTIMELAHLN